MPIYWRSFLSGFVACHATGSLCKLLLGETATPTAKINKSERVSPFAQLCIFFRWFAPYPFNEIKITQRTACMAMPSHLRTEYAQHKASVPASPMKTKNNANAKQEKSPITFESFSSSSCFRTAGDSLRAGKPSKVKRKKFLHTLFASSFCFECNKSRNILAACERNTTRAPYVLRRYRNRISMIHKLIRWWESGSIGSVVVDLRFVLFLFFESDLRKKF